MKNFLRILFDSGQGNVGYGVPPINVPSGGTIVVGANDGLSLDGAIVQLGQLLSDYPGLKAALLDNRYLPMNGKRLIFATGDPSTDNQVGVDGNAISMFNKTNGQFLDFFNGITDPKIKNVNGDDEFVVESGISGMRLIFDYITQYWKAFPGFFTQAFGANIITVVNPPFQFYNPVATDFMILVDSSTSVGGVTIQVDASLANRMLVIKKIDSSVNIVDVICVQPGLRIFPLTGGAANHASITVQGGAVKFISNGTNLYLF